jgi:hypothetical protein
LSDIGFNYDVRANALTNITALSQNNETRRFFFVFPKEEIDRILAKHILFPSCQHASCGPEHSSVMPEPSFDQDIREVIQGFPQDGKPVFVLSNVQSILCTQSGCI